jgi:hypothetical protein
LCGAFWNTLWYYLYSWILLCQKWNCSFFNFATCTAMISFFYLKILFTSMNNLNCS